MEKEELLHCMGVVKSGLCLHSGHLALDKGDAWRCISLLNDVPEYLIAYFGCLSLFVYGDFLFKAP